MRAVNERRSALCVPAVPCLRAIGHDAGAANGEARASACRGPTGADVIWGRPTAAVPHSGSSLIFTQSPRSKRRAVAPWRWAWTGLTRRWNQRRGDGGSDGGGLREVGIQNADGADAESPTDPLRPTDGAADCGTGMQSAACG